MLVAVSAIDKDNVALPIVAVEFSSIFSECFCKYRAVDGRGLYSLLYTSVAPVTSGILIWADYYKQVITSQAHLLNNMSHCGVLVSKLSSGQHFLGLG
jgi:hypothetical protein